MINIKTKRPKKGRHKKLKEKENYSNKITNSITQSQHKVLLVSCMLIKKIKIDNQLNKEIEMYLNKTDAAIESSFLEKIKLLNEQKEYHNKLLEYEEEKEANDQEEEFEFTPDQVLKIKEMIKNILRIK